MPRVRRREAVLWSVRSEERSVMTAVDRVGGGGYQKGKEKERMEASL